MHSPQARGLVDTGSSQTFFTGQQISGEVQYELSSQLAGKANNSQYRTSA